MDNGKEKAVGGSSPVGLPKFLVLSAKDLEHKEEITALRDYVKYERVSFKFPEGLAAVPVLEECRALCDLENFDVLYDLTMQYLVGKTIQICMTQNDGSEQILGQMVVKDKHSDLRVMDCVADYPWLVHWLTEFMANHLAKKFPMPTVAPVQQASGKKKSNRTGTK